MTAYRFGSAAALAMVLGLLQTSSGLFTFASLQLAKIYGPSAAWAQDCTVTVQPGQSIQSAIDAAAEGAVICLAAGAWEEKIQITRGLTLRGAGWEKTKLVLRETSVIISSVPQNAVSLERLTVTGGSFTNIWIFSAKVNIFDSQISSSDGFGIFILGADVTIVSSQLLDNKGFSIYMQESRQLTITNSQISNNGGGILIWSIYGLGLAKATIIDSQISANKGSGIELLGVIGAEVQAEIKNSLIQGNGTSEECKKKDAVCDGITVYGHSGVKLISSKVLNNADWGVGAFLKQCGHPDDVFGGQVVFEAMELSDISGNNTTGNQNGMGNPGNHPWNKLGVPDGQVCLP